MFKNVVGQSFALFAFDATTGVAKTGDAGNISPFVGKDYGTMAALGTASVTEWHSTKAPGWYILTLAQAETNADVVLLAATSSTANIQIVGQLIPTFPPTFTALAISGGAVTAGTVNDKTGYTASVTGDLSATMKTSVQAAADAAITANVLIIEIEAETDDIASIKVQTDKLTFTVANKLDANVKSVNDVTVTGVGTAGSPWGP